MTTSNNSSDRMSPKESKNIFLTLFILILALLILYMGLSMYSRVRSYKKAEQQKAMHEVPADIIQVEVLNGCGTGGVADRFTEYLRRNKFDVVNMSNYRSFDIDETLVVDRTGNKANAYRVADALGINRKNVIQQLNNDYFLDVSIIIGKDYLKLNPLKGGN